MMNRNVPRVLAFALAATLVSGEARAQFGYGYGYGAYPNGYGTYGWSGWGGGGGTVDGEVARGLGYYDVGAGTYNLDTAEAKSINADTIMRWNQYLYLSQQQANARAHLHIAQQVRRDAINGDAVQARLRDNPTSDDIASGSAMNAALDQISDPRIHSSALRLATDKISGKVVRTIPFVNASEAISISLDQMTSDESWPTAFRDVKFDEERKAYNKAVDNVLVEDKDGDISPASIQKLRDILSRMRSKLTANPPVDKAQNGQALLYLKSLYGMTRMLEKPQVDKIIAELEKVKETSLGSLLGFMHTFNLRFGRATTPEQREAYESLYPLLTAHRDRVLKDMKAATKADSKTKIDQPTDFFQGMHLDHLEGKKADGSGK